MFKEIRDERAFNGILNQIIENIRMAVSKRNCPSSGADNGGDHRIVQTTAIREVLRALELLGIVRPVPGGRNYITGIWIPG